MTQIYNKSNLTGLQHINEKITSPTNRSLSGWAIRKIEYLQTKAYLKMHSVLALNLSKILAVAVPVFAVLDTLASPFKVLYCAVTLNGKGVKEELVNSVKHLALIFFSIPASCRNIAKPRTAYHSLETWKNIKADKFAHDLIEKEKELRGEGGELTKESLAKAIKETIPSIVVSEKASARLDKIIEVIAEELKEGTEDSEIVSEHYIKFFSKFILECQNSGLPLDTVDETFFELMTALVRLRMPSTRVKLMKKIIEDFSTNKKISQDFKKQLEALDKEKNQKIEHYLQDMAKKKEGELEKKQKTFEKKKEIHEKAEIEATELEKLHDAMKQWNLTPTQAQEIQDVAFPPKKKKVDLATEIPVLISKFEDSKEDTESALGEKEKAALKQKVYKLATQLRKKADNMKKGVIAAEEALKKLETVDDSSSDEPLISNEELEKKYPSYTSSHFSYVPLYLGLQYVETTSEKESQELYSLVRNSRFKDTNYFGHLMNFLRGLENVESDVAAKAVQSVIEYSQNDNKKFSRTLRALKNANIMLKLGDTERFSSIVKDPTSELKLDSELLIPTLFSEKFDLSAIEKYQGEQGLKALLEDFEKTFAKFRDPIAIMTYYSTLSSLPKSQKEPALESLTTYVKYVLEGNGVLQQKRHDISLNPHLEKMYEKYPQIKEKWEDVKMMKVTDLDSSLSSSPMKNYTIGETEDPCDLLMMSTEVTKSCMHIAGRANKSRGQLGHMLDGKTHPVVIKSDKGKIVARMLMRVLEDKNKQKPILVVDYIYSSSTLPKVKKEQKKLIHKFCKQKAAEMDLDLVTIQPNAKKYGPVESFGSPGAYEHVNTFDKSEYRSIYPDGMTNGNYVVPTTYKVS